MNAMPATRPTEQAPHHPRRPHITLIHSNTQPNPESLDTMNTVNTSMNNGKEYAAKLPMGCACNSKAKSQDDTSGPVAHSLAQLHLVDHAHMVRNSLEAVRCLTMQSAHVSTLANGAHDTLDIVSRHHLCDLMEIITDRLGFALEVEAARASQ
ncbi:hypothetical protein [Rhodoferax sp.]|uniref:hypothetical protein n=1 Tax=Rhodoferax sp. TaxID=50421 RepID=UPI0026064DD9|nr:hypothetical protein [Rhodoferax sp.]MDD5478745.1 hypothetical protein [Rhodoferax sp.]